jgi:Mrp family chromosome partitioning ATPase
MSTNQEFVDKLKAVIDPEIGVNIVDLGMVKNLEIKDGTAFVTIALTVSGCPLSNSIEKDVKRILSGQPGISNVEVQMTNMSREELNELMVKMRKLRSESKTDPFASTNKTGSDKLPHRGIQNVIAVMSGKGGVGKSFVTSGIAVELRRQGFEVGILDADLTGPSIAKVFGLSSKPRVDANGAIPVSTATGIRVMSMNLLLNSPDTPVIWRGPVVDQVIRQLFMEVNWGELNFLLIDLPPGTGDAPLTAMQALPLDAVVIVSTPQDLAMLIVKKSINMARQLHVPLAGIVENMSYMTCPHCSTKINMFEESGIENEADRLGVSFLGKLPFDLRVNRLADSGRLEEYVSAEIQEITAKIKSKTIQLTSMKVEPIAWKRSQA